MNRRRFIQTSLGFTAASHNRIRGANGRIKLGFIGTGKMGWGNMGACRNQINTRITWLCDVWNDNLWVAARTVPGAKLTKNFLEVLEDTDPDTKPDAVCISTPDHWHALMAVMAMQRGLHVYCEKPVAHSVKEFKAMVRAQKKSGKVFQAGMWQHSDLPGFHQAIDWAQSEELGQLVKVNGCLYWQEPNIGNIPDSDPPPSLGPEGWQWWLGPAKCRPFNWVVFQSNPKDDPKHENFARFRYFFDYGGGMVNDWLPHIGAPGLMGMQCAGPYRIESRAHMENVKDMRETPNVWRITADFKDPGTNRVIPFVFDHNGNYTLPLGQKRAVDTEFIYASGAKIRVNRDSFQLIDEAGKVAKEAKSNTDQAGNQHWHDFVDHIREDDANTRTSLAKITQTHMVVLGSVALYRGLPPAAPGKVGGGTMEWNPYKNEMLSPRKEVLQYLNYCYQNGWQMPKI